MKLLDIHLPRDTDKRRSYMCVNPRELKNPYRIVPCGHCYDCQSQRRQDWSVRNQIEFKHNPNAYFITLTYNDDNLTSLKMAKDTYLYLPNKKHYQNFLKRLRKETDLRYFGVHEYGKKTHRPHYHMLLYFQDDSYKLTLSKLHKTWGLGFVTKDKLTTARIHYTTKYLQKPFRQFRHPSLEYIYHTYKDENSLRYELEQYYLYRNTFNFMSTKPAIGHQLLDDHDMINYIKQQTELKGHYPRLHFNNQVYQLPRYYINKIFDQIDREQVYQNYLADRIPNLHDEANDRNQTISEMLQDKRDIDDYKQTHFNKHLHATDLLD